MPAHLRLQLPKPQLRAYATATLLAAGIAIALAYSESALESWLQSPDRGVWITQALNECDLHHLFGMPLGKPRQAVLPAPDSALVHADPGLRHLAIVSGKGG